MEKHEIMKGTLQFLKQNPKTSTDAVRENIESILRARGEIGRKEEHRGGAIYTTNVRISDEDALMINEVIFDLLYKERVITPGFNRDNLNLPWVHVSDINRLEEMLSDE